MPTQEKSQAPAALRTGLALAVGYAAYFLALFAQFPLAGCLPGNCDTWYAIAFTNLYRNELKELRRRAWRSERRNGCSKLK